MESESRRYQGKVSDAFYWKSFQGEDDAVKDCDGSKSPRPNGLNFHPIEKCWSIIKNVGVLN